MLTSRAHLSISRITSTEGVVDGRIQIEIRWDGRKTTAIMSPEDFALAITGKSEVPCRVDEWKALRAKQP